jgi:hypothetical protein
MQIEDGHYNHQFESFAQWLIINIEITIRGRLPQCLLIHYDLCQWPTNLVDYVYPNEYDTHAMVTAADYVGIVM